jgi:hypothetical protein
MFLFLSFSITINKHHWHLLVSTHIELTINKTKQSKAKHSKQRTQSSSSSDNHVEQHCWSGHQVQRWSSTTNICYYVFILIFILIDLSFWFLRIYLLIVHFGIFFFSCYCSFFFFGVKWMNRLVDIFGNMYCMQLRLHGRRGSRWWLKK